MIVIPSPAGLSYSLVVILNEATLPIIHLSILSMLTRCTITTRAMVMMLYMVVMVNLEGFPKLSPCDCLSRRSKPN